MSGTAGDLSVKLGVQGLPQLESAFNQMEARLNTAAAAQRQFEQSSTLARQALENGIINQERYGQTVAAAQGRLEQQTRQIDTATGGMGRFNQVIQQGGYQLGDLTVQIQGGTNALVAISQQGSQFLGMFGPMGAVAGVILSVGTIAANFLLTANNAEVAKTKGQEALDAMAKSGGETSRILRDINDLFLTAAQRSANLANIERGRLRSSTETRIGELTAGSQELRRRLSVEEGFLSDVRTPGAGTLYRAEDNAARDAEIEAITRVKELRRQIAAADREAEKLRSELLRLDNSGAVGAEEYGPTSADPSGANALRASLDKQFAARQAHEAKVNQINQAVRDGAISAAEGDRLAALALQERDAALTKMGETAKKVVQDIRAVYDELRADPQTGILLGSDNDALALRTIRAAVDKKLTSEGLKRANEQTEREQQASLEKMQREAERSVDNISRYVGDAFADVFLDTEGGWDKMWQRMQRVAVASLARMVAEAAVRPIVQSVVLGGSGSASGTAGALSAAGQASTSGGGLLKYSDAASSVGSLFFGGSGPVNTGWTGLDSVLNTEAYTVGGTGQFGPYSAANPAGGVTGVSYGQALAGGASVAGGLYGIYSGLERGGAGGYAQAGSGTALTASGTATLLGGTAAGGIIGATATVAPYIAAILAIAAAFLPGQKPSDMTQTYRRTLDTGFEAAGGLTGDRYSPENASAAKSIADGIADLGSVLRSATGVSSTPYAYEVAVGNRDGISLLGNGRTRDYARDQAGQDQLIRDATADMLAAMRGAFSAEVSGIVDRSGGDLETVLGDLNFYNTTYKQLGAVATQTNALQMALEGLYNTFTPAIALSKDLGLSTADMTARWNEQDAALRAQVSSTYWQASRVAQGRDYINSVEGVRTYYLQNEGAYRTAGRDPETLYWQQLSAQLDQLDTAQLQDVATSFAQLDPAASQLAQQMLALGNSTTRATAAQEAAAAAQEAQAARQNELAALQTLQQRSGVLTSFLDSEAVSGAGVSPQQAYRAAQEQYNAALSAARAGGDLSAYTSAASTLLAANSSYNATGVDGSAVRDMVLSTTRSLGASLDLPGFSTNLEAGLARVMTPLGDQVDNLKTEIAALREELRGIRLRDAA